MWNLHAIQSLRLHTSWVIIASGKQHSRSQQCICTDGVNQLTRLNSFSHRVIMSGYARTALCEHINIIISGCDCINGEHYSWMFHHVLIVKDSVFFVNQHLFFVVPYMHSFHTPWAICRVNKISLIRTLNANSSSTTLYHTVQEC